METYLKKNVMERPHHDAILISGLEDEVDDGGFHQLEEQSRSGGRINL